MYSKSAVTGLVSLCVFAGGLAVSCASALARNTYGVSPAVLVGSEGSGDGQFLDPTGVAVNEVAPGHVGDVYVVDQGNNRVERFSASGGYLGQFNGSDNPNPAFSAGFSAPTWVAVDNSTSPSDPSAGDLYVVDSGHNTIDKFTATGVFIGELQAPPAFKEIRNEEEEEIAAGFAEGALNGIAVGSSGNLWVYNGRSVDRYDDATTNQFAHGWITPFFSGHPGFGVDASEHVYLVGGFSKTLDRLNGKEGEVEHSLNGECAEECFAGLAVNEAASELVAAHAPEGVSPQLHVLGSTGTELQSPFAVAGQLTGIGGLALNAATGQLYVSDPGASDLKIFNATTGGISDQQPTSAAVSGAVTDPGGPAATCEVEYGLTISYGTSAPCTPASLNTGSSIAPVTATLTALTSGETYHYRFTGIYGAATSHGEDQTFRLTPAPLVDQQPGFATNISQSTATLNGTIDPYNLATAYHFVYGTSTAYGSSIPSPDLYTQVNSNDEAVIPQTIAGLQPGTTYHFALVATAPGGTITGPDETFTTPSIFLPEAATGGASGISVGAVTLLGAVNPMGWETTYEFQYGTSTAYGASWPSVGVQAGRFTGAQGVSIYLQNLQPATTYHYRLTATNAAGTAYGADQTFTTPAYPVQAIQEPTGPPPPGKATTTTITKKPLTNAQKLTAALKVCKKEAKKKQAKCVAVARKKYSPAKKKK